MYRGQVARLGFALLALSLLAGPAAARRTVIDGGATLDLGGYCSPNTAGTSDCFAYSLSSPLQIGAGTYNSFYVNSNGTVSLGSIESFLGPQNSDPGPSPQASLTEYPVPIFSPNFVDGPGFVDFFGAGDFDGNFVADTTVNANGFTVSWYECFDPLNCGNQTISLVSGATFDPNEVGNFGLVDALIAASTLSGAPTDEENFLSGQQALISGLPIYTMNLIALADGFQVDYRYNSAALGTTGNYGFSLPTGSFEANGSLENRSFVFNSAGESVTNLPEPMTWMSMIIGFGLMGVAIRRQRPQFRPA